MGIQQGKFNILGSLFLLGWKSTNNLDLRLSEKPFSKKLLQTRDQMLGPENWAKRSKGFKFSSSPKISIMEEMSMKMAQTHKRPMRVIMAGPENTSEALPLCTWGQTTSSIVEEEEEEPMMPICHRAPTVRTLTTILRFTRTNRPLLSSEFYNTHQDPGASYLASLKMASAMRTRVGMENPEGEKTSGSSAASIASRNTISTDGIKIGAFEGDTVDDTSQE